MVGRPKITNATWKMPHAPRAATEAISEDVQQLWQEVHELLAQPSETLREAVFTRSRQAKRLQAMAQRHRAKRIAALGDAVCPPVAEWIGRKLLEAM